MKEGVVFLRSYTGLSVIPLATLYSGNSTWPAIFYQRELKRAGNLTRRLQFLL